MWMEDKKTGKNVTMQSLQSCTGVHFPSGEKLNRTRYHKKPQQRSEAEDEVEGRM